MYTRQRKMYLRGDRNVYEKRKGCIQENIFVVIFLNDSKVQRYDI